MRQTKTWKTAKKIKIKAMKRQILILSFILFAFTLKAQWVNNSEHKSFNFIAPSGATAIKNEVLFPFAENATYDADNDTLTLAVSQYYTFHTTTDTLIANTYFYLTIDHQVTTGAELFILVPAGHLAQNFIPKTGFVGTTVAGTAHKSKYLHFIYNGTAFIHIGTMQID
jgi:hypothetical protein